MLSRLGPKSLAQSMRKQMEAAVLPLFEESYDYKHSAVDNDDLASAMAEFIEPIREVSQIDHEDALEEAYKLVFDAKAWWYNSEADGCDGYTSKDERIDALLLEIINKRWQAGHRWDWKKDLEHLDTEAKDRAGYGVEPWYPESRKALRALLEGESIGINQDLKRAPEDHARTAQEQLDRAIQANLLSTLNSTPSQQPNQDLERESEDRALVARERLDRAIQANLLSTLKSTPSQHR